jgi:hypothetical protein
MVEAQDATPEPAGVPAVESSDAPSGADAEQPDSSPVDEPSAEVTEAPADGAPELDDANLPSAEPDGEDPDSALETPVPSPLLRYLPAERVSCTPVDGDALPVVDTIDYLCTLDIDLHAEGVAESEIAIVWSVDAEIDAGWSVELRTQSGDEWSQPGQASAHLESVDRVGDAAEPADVSDERRTLAAVARAHRPACATDRPTLIVTFAATVGAPERPDAAISADGDQPAPLEVHPEPADLAIVPPAAAITDFSVAPVSFSLNDQVTTGTLALTIDNPAYQCHAWSIAVALDAPGVVAITEVTVEGVAAPVPDWLEAIVGDVPKGAEAGSATLTISFEFTIPGGMATGSYNVAASASILPAGSDD